MHRILKQEVKVQQAKACALTGSCKLCCVSILRYKEEAVLLRTARCKALYLSKLCKGGTTKVNLFAETEADEPSPEAGFQTVELHNKRLRLPLTKAALHRLNALIKRWSLAFGSSELAALQDLEPPEAEDHTDLQHRSLGILGGLDENAFGNSR